ncbi:MAG: ABC transporter ATP-binding protein [Firmicutes bacterium]|nr:ABC transporter ATP-binding protein [Bacillota bacterium]
MAEYLLEVRNVNKSFGGVVTAENVNMTVEAGQIRGLIGPNGAGKTTLLNLISGIYDVDSGNIFFKGQDITNLPSHQRARMGIGRTFQSPRFMNRASIEDNLKVGIDLLNKHSFIQSFFGKKGHDFLADLNELMEIVGFTFDWDDQITALPYGQQKLLEIVRAMLAGPSVILVDEPAAGLNKQEQERASALLRKAVDSGMGVVLIEHSMDMVMSVCDRITVLSFGRVIAEGLPYEIANNKQVIEAYLGGDDDA